MRFQVPATTLGKFFTHAHVCLCQLDSIMVPTKAVVLYGGKVTVGLASIALAVRRHGLYSVYPPLRSRPKEGRSAPLYTHLTGVARYLFLLRRHVFHNVLLNISCLLTCCMEVRPGL